MTGTSRSRSVWIAGGGAVVALALYWAVFGLPLRRGDETPLARERTSEEHLKAVNSAWDRLEMTEIDPADEGLLQKPGSAIAGQVQRSEVLDAGMKGALIAKVGQDLRAKAARTPEEYARFVEGDRTSRWLEAGDELQWKRLDTWWEYAFQERAPRTELKRLLDRYLQRTLKEGARLSGFSDTLAGARVLVFSVRTQDEVYIRVGDELKKLGAEEKDQWLRGSEGAPVAFRVPKRGLSSILNDVGVAKVAVVMTVVRTEAKQRYILTSTYVWDPASGGWMTESHTRRHGSGVQFWY